MMKMSAAAYLLPSEIIYNILARLPVESLFRFRCVSRYLRALIDDPLLKEMHTHRIILDSQDLLDKQQQQQQSDSDSVSFILLARFGKQRFYEFHFAEYFDDEDEYSSSSSSSSRRCCYKVTKPIKYICIDNPDTQYADGGYNIVGSEGRVYYQKRYTRYTEGGTIVGSCNGLVCFATFINETYNLPDLLYVFNPVTKEHFRVPNFDKKSHVQFSMNGFGYLSSTKEYKVVKIFYKDDYSPGRVEVYTLGSGKWRSIERVPSIFVSFVRSSGVLVNEALHWIDEDGKIALFDLATERFRMVSSPSSLTLVPNNDRYYELGVMRGRNLCVIEHNIHKCVDIWVMMDNNNTEDGSWTMEFKIPIRGEIRRRSYNEFNSVWEKFDDYNFVTITKSGKVLLWYNGTWLVSYDPKTEEFTFHEDYKADLCWFEAVFHRKSFVSFKSLGEDSLMFAELEC